MLLGIDGNEANVTDRVGIGAYAYFLLCNMIPQLGKDSTLRVYLKNEPGSDMPKADNLTYEVFGPRKLWTQIGLPLRLYGESSKPDVFFSPTHYAPRFSPVPVAISVMDLSFLHFPQTFTKKDVMQLSYWTSYSVKKAAAIFTISEASKSDIIKKYSVPAQKIHVTYPGVRNIVTLKPSLYPMRKLKEKYKINGEYFLFVGTLQPRKNIEKLVEAFSLVKKESANKDLQLVIVGKKGWLYEDILKAPKEYGVSEDVVFLDFVTDEDLPDLYGNAISFVLPSLYEGFGLPVLEAMSYGCPVITSDVSSLPEAGGDAALYVDPKDALDIAKKMNMLLNDKSLRESLIVKGKTQLKKFSWEKAAGQTLEVLEKLGDHAR